MTTKTLAEQLLEARPHLQDAIRVRLGDRRQAGNLVVYGLYFAQGAMHFSASYETPPPEDRSEDSLSATYAVLSGICIHDFVLIGESGVDVDDEEAATALGLTHGPTRGPKWDKNAASVVMDMILEGRVHLEDIVAKLYEANSRHEPTHVFGPWKRVNSGLFARVELFGRERQVLVYHQEALDGWCPVLDQDAPYHPRESEAAHDTAEAAMRFVDSRLAIRQEPCLVLKPGVYPSE